MLGETALTPQGSAGCLVAMALTATIAVDVLQQCTRLELAQLTQRVTRAAQKCRRSWLSARDDATARLELTSKSPAARLRCSDRAAKLSAQRDELRRSSADGATLHGGCMRPNV